MKRQIAILSAVFILALLMAASPLLSQGRGGNKNVPVMATFRDAPEDTIRSDGRGPYFSGQGLQVYLRSEGSINFDIDSQSGRRMIFIFPKCNRIRPVYDPEHPDVIDINQFCLYNPDSLNPPETQIIEPTKFVSFYTYNSEGFAPPKYDLLSMIPGQVVQVRFWIYFCTYKRDDFFVAENERVCDTTPYGFKVGWVWVKAIDMDGNPLTVERWEITPWNPINPSDPLSKGWANLWRNLPAKRGVTEKCEYGDFEMPFMLWLDRVK